VKARIGALAALTALVIAGCGGKSRTQILACWTKAAVVYAKSQSANSSIASAMADTIVLDARLYGEGQLKGQLASDLSTPEINAWLVRTQKVCGKLT
jgi:hypothetical protein